MKHDSRGSLQRRGHSCHNGLRLVTTYTAVTRAPYMVAIQGAVATADHRSCSEER